MREPDMQAPVFGLLAEFSQAESLIAGVRHLRKAGFRQIDAYSPFPVEGLAEALAMKDNRVAWSTLVGGLIGMVLGYGMQVYTNLDYPINIGNRPLIPSQAFVLVTFELTILLAVLSCIGSMLVLNRLPRLHHPVFGVETFHLASANKFFLIVFSNDRKFDPVKTRKVLNQVAPLRIDLVTRDEMMA
jgi:hypothetical protein